MPKILKGSKTSLMSVLIANSPTVAENPFFDYTKFDGNVRERPFLMKIDEKIIEIFFEVSSWESGEKRQNLSNWSRMAN